MGSPGKLVIDTPTLLATGQGNERPLLGRPSTVGHPNTCAGSRGELTRTQDGKGNGHSRARHVDRPSRGRITLSITHRLPPLRPFHMWFTWQNHPAKQGGYHTAEAIQ